MKQLKSLLTQISILLITVATFNSCFGPNPTIDNLTVEYSATPLGIDVAHPRFGWQMLTQNNDRGMKQHAYQIIVKNPSGEVLWDTEKAEASPSEQRPKVWKQQRSAS